MLSKLDLSKVRDDIDYNIHADIYAIIWDNFKHIVYVNMYNNIYKNIYNNAYSNVWFIVSVGCKNNIEELINVE